MSEMDRAPLIRLQIDQEVFQDAVRDGDVIEDATVATEVTSFERVGDAYVLEGAIVFAGYINHTDPDDATRSGGVAGQARGTQPADSQAWDALSMGFADTDVQHLHNRLPFVLRVPVRSQARGIVNVASRISDWKLDTVSAGWLRVIADLSIVGLSGNHGYHFECGSQEYGDVFFQALGGAKQRDQILDEVDEAKSEDVDVGVASQWDETSGSAEQNDAAAPDQEAQAQLDLQLTRGSKDTEVTRAVHSRHAREDSVLDAAETVSGARGGAAGSDTGKGEAREHGEGTGSAAATGAAQSESAHRELEHLDKAFSGNSQVRAEADAKAEHTEDVSDTQQRASESRRHSVSLPRTRTSHGNVVEFDFEHQVTADDLRQAQEAKPVAQNGADAAVRGDTSSTTRAPADSTPARVPDSDDQANVVMHGAEADEPEESSFMPSELWSFVDFNSPEQQYTLRYVIVSEEESIDSLADRVGVRKSDLLRANELTDEGVHPGQTLAIPGHPVV